MSAAEQGTGKKWNVIAARCVGVLCVALCVWAKRGDWKDMVVCLAALAVWYVVAEADIKTMNIPDWTHLALLCIGIADCFLTDRAALWERGVGVFAVSLPMFLLALLIENAFGGGDIKLMAVGGFLLGWKGILTACFLGFVAGGVGAVCLMLGRKKSRKDLFVFGPFLCMGLAVALLYGKEILAWYLGQFT